MHLTQLETIEDEYNQVKLIFGTAEKAEYKTHKFRDNTKLIYFLPDSIFAFQIYRSNQYGNTKAELYICRALHPMEPGFIIPNVKPGAELLFDTRGVANCKNVINWLDTLKEAGTDPAAITAADYIRANALYKTNKTFTTPSALHNLLRNTKRRK